MSVSRSLPLCLLVLCASLLLAGPAEAAPISLQSLEVQTLSENGTVDTQAGSHPFELQTSFLLGAPEELQGEGRFRVAGGGLKDVRAEFPSGFSGDPYATPRCTYHEFSEDTCPTDTAVGIATTEILTRGSYENLKGENVAEVLTINNPVYNVEPPGGVPAEFAYYVKNVAPIFLDTTVRTGGDYGLTTNARNIPQTVAVYGSTVKIWGVPEAATHDAVRGSCLAEDETAKEGEEYGYAPVHDDEASNGECPVDVPVEPLLTNPTSCGEARPATLSVDGWGDPGVFASETTSVAPLEGCEKLDFSPTVDVVPDGTAASTPTGLNVDLHIPQEATTNPVGLGEADVRDSTVTLPAGVQIDPSAADGQQACSLAQIGFLAEQSTPGNAHFTPNRPSCPEASKLATVRLRTPLLEHEMTGEVYLAAPQNFAGALENPFGSLFALYLVAEEPETGVLIKLPGKISLSETGQITTSFENTPALPFEELKLEFFGGDRAPLATPALCGTYQTESAFTPWSGTPAATPLSHFQITSGPNGASCSDPLPFSPSLASGTTNINAGSFSDLTTTLSREDGQQQIQQVTLHYPPGLSGILTGVKLCGEAEANAGTCGPESQIGETTVSVGLGNDPFTVTGGKVYLTGPYEGAPFGLSIVNPAKAGPFDLQEGRPVVVRATVNVDPHTAALTVTTNTAAQGYAIPSMIEGIPLQIKHVNVNITRPGFTFNPTNCTKTQITGTVASAEGASSPVQIPFQVGECRSLAFAPKISFATSAKTSKSDGADLVTKVTYPSAPQGTYANLGYVKVELPKQLPSRLTTLQKACTDAQFEANPAGCPAASKIGYATVHTPLLPVPLTGPAIFVSHGGEAFPSLTMVLQGYGVTIDLVGTTFISKSGITSTTFKTVPDQPFSSFELVLPQGPFSALAANGNLCTEQSSLKLPVQFVGQNGATLNQDPQVSVTGCKPAITVVKHSVKGKTATIQVTVPSAGKLVATGKGLIAASGSSKATKSTSSATGATLTLKLTLTKAETARLKKHRGRKLLAKIKLAFTPKKGAKLAASTTVYIG